MVLCIGACEIDRNRRRVVRDGAEQPLSRKAFDLLLALVDARPNVMSKDALIKHVWPTTFVADANLAILIGDVRAALGDSAQHPTMIRTHHRVGYSFIGDVREVAGGSRVDAPALFMLVAGKRRIVLHDGTVTVGRDETCDIVLDHPSVSRVHAWLIVDGDTISVRDHDSKNGTRIDKTRISGQHVLRAGQQVSFGRVDTIIAEKDAAGSTFTYPDTAS